MNDKQETAAPFSGYRVTLVSGSSLPESAEDVREHPVLARLRAGKGAVLSPRDAAILYETVEAAAEKHGSVMPLQFIPIRCNRKQALPFESVALSAIDILHIVHEDFFGGLRCRQAAIAAVQSCGALPVPSIGLGPVGRRAPRRIAEQHVDTLIDREAEVHISSAAARPPRACP
jgi:hypothetical protein